VQLENIKQHQEKYGDGKLQIALPFENSTTN
jgi:hypothetical protein